MDDAPLTDQALSRLHPRTLQVLVARFVAKTDHGPGRTASEFASFYGVPDASARVLLWRAARELMAARTGAPAPGPLPFDDELRAANALHEGLEAPLPATSQELSRTIDVLKGLTARADSIREQLAAAEKAELASPAYARETWLRRLAIVVVLALSAWFWRADLAQWLHRLQSGR